MAKRKTKRTIEIRNIDSLKNHPSQTGLFSELTDTELRDLANDIQQNGLQNPIEILSDGTIICGHQRVAAYRLLGLKKIPCRVRKDLEEQGEAAVERRLIEDNLHRRQLSKLGIARCYQRLKEAALQNGWEQEDEDEDLRDHLAKRFEMSGKQVERYVKMLDAPRAVQQAYEADKLTQKDVLTVVALAEDEQQQIADQIEAGADAKDVVKPFVEIRQVTEVGVETVVHRLVRALTTAEGQISNRLDELPGRCLEPQLNKLLKGVRFLKKLHKDLKKQIDLEESDDYYDEF